MKSIVRTPLHEIRLAETNAVVKEQNLQNLQQEKEVLVQRVDMVEDVLQEVLLTIIPTK